MQAMHTQLRWCVRHRDDGFGDAGNQGTGQKKQLPKFFTEPHRGPIGIVPRRNPVYVAKDHRQCPSSDDPKEHEEFPSEVLPDSGVWPRIGPECHSADWMSRIWDPR